MQDALFDAITVFQGIVIEAAPFILLGVLVSSLLGAFVTDAMILRIMPRNRLLGVIGGALFGFLFPVCECGNIPVARRLLQKGVPPHVVISFLLAAPVFNPVVMLATWTAFRDQPAMLYWRVGLTLAIAIIVGLLFSLHPRPKEMMAMTHEAHHDHHHEGRVQHLMATMAQEFMEMMAILIVGATLASLVQIVVPRTAITALGHGPVLSVLVMMLLAFVISICSTVDAFFALSFSTSFSSHALLAFLVFGPMIDIKTLVMLRSTFRPSIIAWLAALTALLTLAGTLFLSLYIS